MYHAIIILHAYSTAAYHALLLAWTLPGLAYGLECVTDIHSPAGSGQGVLRMRIPAGTPQVPTGLGQ